jgi:hypothetical protein
LTSRTAGANDARMRIVWAAVPFFAMGVAASCGSSSGGASSTTGGATTGACSPTTSSTGAGGAGGGTTSTGTGTTSGAGGGGCLRCAAAFSQMMAGTTPDVCAGSSTTLFTNLKTCACNTDACANACMGTICAEPPVAPDTGCSSCLSAGDSPGPGCDNELMACDNDA